MQVSILGRSVDPSADQAWLVGLDTKFLAKLARQRLGDRFAGIHMPARQGENAWRDGLVALATLGQHRVILDDDERHAV
jgi:hypothetical protein